jgi:hypothetical protein
MMKNHDSSISQELCTCTYVHIFYLILIEFEDGVEFSIFSFFLLE